VYGVLEIELYTPILALYKLFTAECKAPTFSGIYFGSGVKSSYGFGYESGTNPFFRFWIDHLSFVQHVERARSGEVRFGTGRGRIFYTGLRIHVFGFKTR
jgi:hypothetical protein